jgi:hypothetical protein
MIAILDGQIANYMITALDGQIANYSWLSLSRIRWDHGKNSNQP